MKVRTRFPPENAGYLHIGHVKAIYSNYKFAKENGGEMIVRMDDTNPDNCTQEYADLILEDLHKLQLIDKNTLVTYTSSYFDILFNYAIELTKSGNAYVDDIPKETIKKNRTNKIESKNRNNTIDQNLTLLNQMFEGLTTSLTLRAKIDMNHENACMRDPVLYRSGGKHYRTKDEYRIYPMYDFSCPILDSIENITHTFRTSEYSDRTELYFWVLDKLNLRKPHLQLFSSLTFDNTVLSKRKLRWLIQNNYITGWDDPRICTIRGLSRRGFTVEAILKYIDNFYLSKNVSKQGSYASMVSINNDLLDKYVPRYTAINKENIYTLIFDPPVKEYTKIVPLHPKLEIGMKEIVVANEIYLEGEDIKLLKEGDEVTLFNLGNTIITKIDGNTVVARPNFDGDFKTTKYKLTWLAKKDVIDVILNEFSHILKTPKLMFKDKDIDPMCINTDSHQKMSCYGETSINKIKQGTHIQLYRRGFYIVDKNDDIIEFNRLPDSGKKVNHLSAFAKN